MTRKTILITGASDGIGRATAERLAGDGHHLLLHGRNLEKLAAVAEACRAQGASVESFEADLSDMDATAALADRLGAGPTPLDVLINNAGVLRTKNPITASGLDIRFAVNTLAPYLLTRRLMPQMAPSGRVVNVASAAQAPVDLAALRGERRLSEMEAYAQSKLAIIMWSRHLAAETGTGGVAMLPVNPGSLLASKMVKDGFGVAGNDIGIGAAILADAAVGPRFDGASGRYFDNDSGRFADPAAPALDANRCAALVATLDDLLR